MFRDEAQSADLRIGSSLDANVNHAPETNRDIVAKPDARGLDDACLDGVTRQMDTSNDHVVAAFKQVVVTDRKTVDVHSFAEACATGAADTPHTRVWTVTSDAMVQAMRQATTGRDGTLRELTGITGSSHA